MDFKKTALLLVDLQNEEGTSEIARMDEILSRSKMVLETCRQKGIPVFYTRHINHASGIGLANKEPLNWEGEPIYYHSETDNIEVAQAIQPAENDMVIDKYRYSGFHETSLDLMLRSMGIQHLIIGGVLTDVCVLSTALDAYYRDYQVNIIKDMCGTTAEGAHMAAVLMMANWIYDIEIYDAREMKHKLLGKHYHAWTSSGPDELQFSPDNLKEMYAKLTTENTDKGRN